METTKYLGVTAKKAKPTKNHRPAVWECMLGTVYALNDKGEAKYFDYDHAGALKFAGIDRADADPRLHKIGPNEMTYRWTDDEVANPRRGKLVLWVTRTEQ